MSRNLPVLYEYDEFQFGTSNGIGVLNDCIDCTVNETLNEEFELVLKYPFNGVLFNELKTSRIIYAKPSPSRPAEPFRIYRFNKIIRDSVEFSARHISYDLIGHVLVPVWAEYYKPKALFSRLNERNSCYTGLTGYVFQTDLYDDYSSSKTYNFGDYVIYPGNSSEEARIYKAKQNNIRGIWDNSKWDLIDNKMTIKKPVALRSIFGTGENTMLGSYGGEFKYEYHADEPKVYVKLLQSRGADRGVYLRYGVNLTDVNQEKNISDMYTGVLPFYAGSDDTIVTGAPTIITLPNSEDVVTKVLVLDVSGDFTDIPTNDQVTEMGQKYIAINEYDKPKVSIDIKQPELINLGTPYFFTIELGDWVHIYYEKLGISTKAKVVSTSYDVLNDKYKEIQIGDVKNTIVRTIAQQTGAITNIVNNYYGDPGGGGGGDSATAVFG